MTDLKQFLIDMHSKLNALYQPEPFGRPKTFHASFIGYPCMRNIVYRFLNWDAQKPPTPHLLRIWKMGKIIEKEWIKQAKEIWNIYEQEEKEWRKYNISGKYDGIIEFDKDKRLLFDIKSVYPLIWDKFDEENPDEWKTLLKMPFHNCVPAQGQIYMLLNDMDEFLLIFVNKSNLEEKFIYMPLDYEYAESLIKKAELLQMYIENEQYPEPIEYDIEICGATCAFYDICLPKRKVDGAEFIEDEDIKEAFIRYFELKELAKEYEEVNAYLKAQLGKYSKGGFCDNGNFEFAIKEIFYKAQPQKVILPKEERVEKRIILIDHRKNTKQI